MSWNNLPNRLPNGGVIYHGQEDEMWYFDRNQPHDEHTFWKIFSDIIFTEIF